MEAAHSPTVAANPERPLAGGSCCFSRRMAAGRGANVGKGWSFSRAVVTMWLVAVVSGRSFPLRGRPSLFGSQRRPAPQPQAHNSGTTTRNNLDILSLFSSVSDPGGRVQQSSERRRPAAPQHRLPPRAPLTFPSLSALAPRHHSPLAAANSSLPTSLPTPSLMSQPSAPIPSFSAVTSSQSLADPFSTYSSLPYATTLPLATSISPQQAWLYIPL